MSVVEIEGARVAFRVDGTGPGLVLVHGTGGNSDTNWSELVGELSGSRTVVRPDYSGSGDTVDDGHPLTAKALAEQVVAAAKAAGATPFDILGFSLGAAVSAYIAAEYPDLVRSVVLLAGFTSSADPRQAMQFELWRDLIALDRHAMARFILLTGFSSEFLSKLGLDAIAEAAAQITANNNWDGMARQVELDLTIDVSEQARRIVKPTLVIGCTHDEMVPVSHARHLASLIPGARYDEMATGHLAPLENPKELLRIVQGFLERDIV